MSDSPHEHAGDSGNGAGAPPAPGPEVIAMVQVVASVVKLLIPTCADEIAIQCAQMSVVETGPLGEILEDLQGQNAIDNPGWGLKLNHQALGEQGVLISGPKNMHPGSVDLNSALRTVQVLAITTSPMARAVLRALGFQLNFVQIKGGSSLILPG